MNAVHTYGDPPTPAIWPRCRCAGLGSACIGSPAPPTALPYALAPDVLNLDACPDCMTYDQPNSQGYTGLATWRDSNVVPGVVVPERKAVRFTKGKSSLYWCSCGCACSGA